MAENDKLRARLLAQIAGESGKQRGNALLAAELERVKPFASACAHLMPHSQLRDRQECVAAPSELLPLLP